MEDFHDVLVCGIIDKEEPQSDDIYNLMYLNLYDLCFNNMPVVDFARDAKKRIDYVYSLNDDNIREELENDWEEYIYLIK